MAGIWVREGNSIRIDMSVLDPIIARVEAKVKAICDPEEESYDRWMDALKYIKVSGDYKLLTAYEKFISDENSDPRIIDTFVAALRGKSTRAYRSVDSMTPEHLEAFWRVRQAITDHDIRSRRKWNDRDDRPLYFIVFEDPSKAQIMRSIIDSRGVIDAKTMRGMLSGIDSSATMLVDGAL